MSGAARRCSAPSPRAGKQDVHCENGPAPRKRANRLNWEAENGPIPEGFVLKSLDNDSLNVAASNWVLMPRKLSPAARVRIQEAPRDVKEAAIASEALKVKLLKFCKEHGVLTEQRRELLAERERRKYEAQKRKMQDDPAFAAEVRARWRKKERNQRARKKDGLS